MIEFQAFPKIPRLSRTVIISEKIDGTSGCVVVPEDPAEPLLAQSRNRFITPTDDNYGFAKWVQEHDLALRALGPGRHFGEWYGCGINRNYGLADRRFALFNTSRWSQDVWWFLERERVERESHKKEGDTRSRVFTPPPLCCGVVPVLDIGVFDTEAIDMVLEDLANKGSLAVVGFMKPEGVVIYHLRGGCFFKKTLGDDGAKGQ